MDALDTIKITVSTTEKSSDNIASTLENFGITTTSGEETDTSKSGGFSW
jgi:hypothetical protein